jgi:hypothetical protein
MTEFWTINLSTMCGCEQSFIRSGRPQEKILMPLRPSMGLFAEQNVSDIVQEKISHRTFRLVKYSLEKRTADYMEDGK